MKRIKKFFVALLALAMLCGSSVVYVSAAENQIMSTNFFVYQDASRGDASVTFTFDYSDGNSAKLAAVVNNSSDKYTMPNPPTSYFAADTCYASIVLVNKTTGAKVTLRAWCDIYGDTDEY